LRHAEAADGMSDDIRPLTRKGQDQACAMGTFLAERGIAFDAAFTSPLVRAVETAEIVLALTQGKKSQVKLQTTDRLLNETGARQFEAWLKELGDCKEVLLVGHNPSLTERVARLLGAQASASLDLSKGALAVVKLDRALGASLKMYLTPKQTGFMKEDNR
jgi:phosphohistidine phosphatase